jgi:predicted hotdog family 3-hydroxylacyl-ACP dehydratase
MTMTPLSFAFAFSSLNHTQIAALIPHSGSMCLLDQMLSATTQHIVCVASNHRDATHPLRTRSGLLSTCAIEYAAQAMALHGALLGADADARAGAAPRAGYLASARGVRLRRMRLDDLPQHLHIEATRQAGDGRQILYAFQVSHAGQPVAEGRAAVVLNTALT